jgi:hypothetical protein
MTIEDFISRWNNIFNNSADKNGDVKIKKSNAIQFKIDLHNLIKNDSKYISNIEYYSYYDAAKQWYEKKGIESVSEIANKYKLDTEGLQIYIKTALSLRDVIPPFEKDFSIWDLFYFTKHRNQPTIHYLSDEAV